MSDFTAGPVPGRSSLLGPKISSQQDRGSYQPTIQNSKDKFFEPLLDQSKARAGQNSKYKQQ
jgi:hypothetical protein